MSVGVLIQSSERMMHYFEDYYKIKVNNTLWKAVSETCLHKYHQTFISSKCFFSFLFHIPPALSTWEREVLPQALIKNLRCVFRKVYSDCGEFAATTHPVVCLG